MAGKIAAMRRATMAITIIISIKVNQLRRNQDKVIFYDKLGKNFYQFSKLIMESKNKLNVGINL